ncbi:MAG: transporter substrate-binding domain-containing protein [Desulfobacula sp.]|nr:transporter substrate-binding domain-containing protein [Desulfobacula sp.]
MKRFVIILFFILHVSMAFAQTQTLTILYFKRPPYYNTVNGNAEGFLVEFVRKVFQDAGVRHVFAEMPPQRILHYLKNSQKRICSIGWFKTKQRQEFAKFSLSIYQNKPLVILTTKSYQQQIVKHQSIKDVFLDRSLSLARIDSFSYGAVLDEWINNYAPKVHGIPSNQLVLPQLIVFNRASYMLVAPEEIDTMLVQAKLDPNEFISISKSDIPQGNKRYIIYSKNVENDLIKRVNQAIVDQLSLTQ